jgi:predicted nucleic acid-binding protein
VKVYLDNVIASAWVRDDLGSLAERSALRVIRTHTNFDLLEIVTSRESWREQERTQNAEVREELRVSRDKTPVVSEDHKVLGFNSVDLGFRGVISSPLLTDIVDEAMFLKLQTLGLKGADARHLMYALCNGCVRFVTTDPDFLERRSVIEAAYAQVRIVMPTELLQQMEQLR